jgi:hypothetical protein
MLETIQNFESVVTPAARDYPLCAIAPSSAAVVAGLFVWLGGLGFKRVLMAIAGAAGGFALGYSVIGWSVIQAAVSAGVAAVIAAIFDRVFIALLAAILAAGVGFVMLVGLHISAENAQNEPKTMDAMVESTESMEQLTAYLNDLGGNVRSACSQVLVYQWLIVGILSVIILMIGFIFRRLAAAVSFSVLGTLLIAAGLVVLLLYSGSAPLSRAGDRPLKYAGIFAGMAAFGAVEQLLFCRGGVLKPAKKATAEGDDAWAGKKKQKIRRFDW